MRLLAASGAAFAVAWGGSALVGEGRLPKPSAAPAVQPASLPPLPGRRLTCRRVVFNGLPSLVSTWRFGMPEEAVVDRITSDLIQRGLSGREVGASFQPLSSGEREAWEAGALFTVERIAPAERLAWRDPKAGIVEVVLRPEGPATWALWSERTGRAWRPESGGDCPGRDLDGIGRPEGWRRLFCIDAGDGLLLCYEAPGAPQAAVAAYGRLLEREGWRRRPGALAGGAAWVLGEVRCLVSAQPCPGGAQVSVVRSARGAERGMEGS